MEDWETKLFHVADILSVTSGRLVSPRGIVGVFDLLDWLTGTMLMRHELPEAIHHCRPGLLKQFPALQKADCYAAAPSLAKEWLESAEEIYGTWHRVKRTEEMNYPDRNPNELLQDYIRPKWGTVLVEESQK